MTNRSNTGGDHTWRLEQLPRNVAVNIQFEDITYRVKDGNKTKNILNGISGKFHSGELTAIIGPSGSGKTTLLNLLAGYRIHTTSGTVSINDNNSSTKELRKVSRYVLQDDDFSPYFTVMETMMFASLFKLDSSYSKEERRNVIETILDTFHLKSLANTMLSKASGGERKRISIALELIDKPAVLLLDEPITGLDEVSGMQCLRLMKQFANCGHTIICSLHCPSARMIEVFNKVYALSNGECVYQGTVANIVPFLKELNLHCPLTYNPLDFIIDVSTKSYGNHQKSMVLKIGNGSCFEWSPDEPVILPPQPSQRMEFEMIEDRKKDKSGKSEHMLSWWQEYRLIFWRFTQHMWRNTINFKLRIVAQILGSAFIGLSFFECSRNALYSIFDFNLVAAAILFVVFISFAPIFGSVPRDIELMKMEYFNQWYRLSSYFMALLTSQFTILFPMTIVGSALIYFISGQPLQLHRFTMFTVSLLLVAFMALCFGLMLGTSLRGVHALYIGPLLAALMTVFAHQTVAGDSKTMLQNIVLTISFMTYSLEALLVPILGMDRPEFPCPPAQIFCLTSNPEYVLKLYGWSNIDYTRAVVALNAFALLFATISFVMLRYRLNFRKKSKS
ncbi:ATP-binding cassette sub-family G member 1 [Stomoxys calcitrans]|uniref:ATP-binding cassette sub-family G member 1 n=1 Tax=Stomoxys calcitrans TaxID=35570 RepID=UPI0027E2AABA|nr:ATP-binding cassette sub-family G member 1 [Stomoxys calcitrans]